MLGPQDLWIALALGVFFFGGKKLPELSRSVGQAMTEFKKGLATGMSASAPAARCNTGAAAACPSVVSRASPSSSRSSGRGAPGLAGSARTAWQISSRTSLPAACPAATNAAPQAVR